MKIGTQRMKIKNQWYPSVCFIIGLVIMLGGFSSAEVIDKIVAIVNSDIITLVELNNESAPYLQRIEKGNYTTDQKKQMVKDVHEKVLNSLIDRSLTNQEVKRYNIRVEDSEIDSVIEKFKSSRSISHEDLEQMLAQDGLTFADYRGKIEQNILQSKLINHAVKSKVVITESEIKEYYDSHAKEYAGVKKHHLRNILNSDEERIEEIYKKLKKNAQFTTLAEKYSTAPNASDGGDLGVFDISNFSEEIKSQISGLQKGQFTKVISTSQGFQIFFVEDVVLEGNMTLEQAHDEIHDRLYRVQAEKKFKTWLESLKKRAHIELKL